MHYSKYYKRDSVNGEGLRSTLFVSGCIHACKGCYNQSTWSPTAGKEYTREFENQIIADLNDKEVNVQGLSLTGGDPLYVGNLVPVLGLIRRVRRECPGKDIWLWTGFTLHELQSIGEDCEINALRLEIISEIDVLIDGKFEEEKKDPSLAFRGSSNQIIHKFTEF